MKIAKVLLLPSLVLVFSCGNGNSKNAGANPDAVKPYPVITITEQTTTLSSSYPATIEGQLNIEIRPKIDGYIEKMYVDEGASVKKGQALFQINAPQYEQEVRTALANIKIAEADVSAANMQVQKVLPLVEKNIISKYELESAQFTLQAKQAALAQAKATLVNAQTNLGYTRVSSPVSGVVGTIPYKIGSLVSSNTTQPLTTVSDIQHIYAYFSINERQAIEFAENQRGLTTQQRIAAIPPVTLILANGVAFSHQGRIETASGIINTQTGSISVRANFPNPEGLIRSGGSGEVLIPSTLHNAILVPQKSTYEIQGKKFVYLVSDSGTVSSTEIKIRDNTGGQFYVVNEGLKPGNKVVLEGVNSLREGLHIKPTVVSADSIYKIKEN